MPAYGIMESALGIEYPPAPSMEYARGMTPGVHAKAWFRGHPLLGQYIGCCMSCHFAFIA